MSARESNPGSLYSLSLHRLKHYQCVNGKAVGPEFIEEPTAKSIFRPGRNVWKEASAKRASFLIDADRYFKAFVEAAANAEKQIFIIGWDTDSRTELPLSPNLVGGAATTIQLGEFLQSLVLLKPELRIYVVSWDFSFIYLFERESLPSFKFSNLDSDRIRFVLDCEHPFCASHHQKIVVIDDQIAFSGGLDLTQRRWDTSEHRSRDERRVDPGGNAYGPFHDVQICVEGEIAQDLGDIARERWEIATGESIEASQCESAHSRWPVSARVDFQEISVGIARTLPGRSRETQRNRAVIEVERLFIDSIRAAKHYVYFENQYFTSPVIAKAIAKRLREPSGPEFVMVLPRDQTGWIEEGTMGRLRSKALKIVEDADVFGRFRCYYPVVPGLTEGYVKVHSKVTIVDDLFVRIGSANMNSRSMGLDTECDLVIESRGKPAIRTAIARLRRELLGEHLNVEPAEFEARFAVNGSLVSTVESFRGRERTLMELHPQKEEWLGKVLPPGEWLDPRGPRGVRRWLGKRLNIIDLRSPSH